MSDIIDKSYCPECKSKNDGHTEIKGSDAEPSDGDLSICAYCGTLARYVVSDNVRKLARLNEEETRELMKHPDIISALALARSLSGA